MGTDREMRLLGEMVNKPLYKNFTTGDVSYQMKPTDNCIVATSDQADGVAILTLPALAEAVGRFFYIHAPTGLTAGDISVYQKETGAELTTYGDLDADNDHVILYASPTAWRVVLNGVA